jgi:hypothetical protein
MRARTNPSIMRLAAELRLGKPVTAFALAAGRHAQRASGIQDRKPGFRAAAGAF